MGELGGAGGVIAAATGLAGEGMLVAGGAGEVGVTGVACGAFSIGGGD